ncbi:MAG: hypothetical protein MJA28_11955 [Gammaproteobacteria bacterium]|nr:hypothetical protein [Gammaproteobacteria bacterium]
MSRKDWTEYDKQCRAPFTDAGGNITLPKHPYKVDASYLQQLAALTDQVPDAHKQGFIRLHRRMFGLKVLDNCTKE